jgi:hypothetical protein
LGSTTAQAAGNASTVMAAPTVAVADTSSCAATFGEHAFGNSDPISHRAMTKPRIVPECDEALHGLKVWNAAGTNRARITDRPMFPSVHG